MKKFQKGFTLVELITAIWAVVCIALFVGLICVVIHFIGKFW